MRKTAGGYLALWHETRRGTGGLPLSTVPTVVADHFLEARCQTRMVRYRRNASARRISRNLSGMRKSGCSMDTS